MLEWYRGLASRTSRAVRGTGESTVPARVLLWIPAAVFLVLSACVIALAGVARFALVSMFLGRRVRRGRFDGVGSNLHDNAYRGD
jgi:hypothetical protein